MAKPSNEFKRWAALGARARLAELQAEIHRIRMAFPALQQDGRESAPPQDRKAAAQPAPRRRKRTMSAEARKRIGDAQRRRWAAQRRKGTPADASAASAKKKVGRKAGRKRATR